MEAKIELLKEKYEDFFCNHNATEMYMYTLGN